MFCQESSFSSTKALRLAAAQREEIVLSTDGAPVQETLMDIDNEEDANAIRTRMTERPPSEEAIAKFTSYGECFSRETVFRLPPTQRYHIPMMSRRRLEQKIPTSSCCFVFCYGNQKRV